MAKKVDGSWKQIQQKTFTNWFNDRLRGNLKVAKVKVDDLETDLADGILLITLLENLAKPRKVGRYNKDPRNKLMSIENLGKALQFIKSENIKLVNIGPEDINGCNLKLILGLVWTLIGHYQIRSSGRGLSTKQAMKEWLHTLIPEYEIQNFNTDWNDGRAVCGLVDRLKPGLCPNHKSLSPSNGLENCRLGMGLAEEHLGVPMVLDPEDLHNSDVDDLSVMTYVSYFFEPAGKSLLDWIQMKIPQQKVTNFTTDWNNGLNLAALMESCHKGLVPDWKDLDPHNALENLDKCVRLAKARLSIECPVKPENLSDPKVDEIIVATYISRFRYSKLLANADELSICHPDLSKTGAGIIKEPFEVPLDLGDSPDLALPSIKVTATGPSAEAVVTLDTSNPHHTKATFIPIEPGAYTISCKMNDDEINGSPYTVTIIDPQLWSIEGGPPKNLLVGKETELTVAGPAYDSSPVVAMEITNNQGFPATHLEGSITEIDPEKHKLLLNPMEVGPTDISLTVAGKNIQQSPFSVLVCDPTQCIVSGIDPDETVILGDPIQFSIDAEGCGDEKPVMTIRGPSGKSNTLDLDDNENGQYEISFTPSEAGENFIDVTVAGEPIPGSPFAVPVLDPDQWKITSDVPEYIQIGVPLHIRLEGPAIGDPVVVFNVQDVVTSEEAEFASTSVEKEEAGAYDVVLTCSQIGKVEGHVMVAEKEAKGSPFVSTVCDSSKCVVSGLDEKDVKIGDPVQFIINTTGSGDDVPKVNPQGPTVSYVPTIENPNDNEYEVSFTPKETGVHTIPVTFGGQDVPDSPFTIAVIDPNSWNFISDIPKFVQVNEAVTVEIGSNSSVENGKGLTPDTSNEDILTAELNEVTPSKYALTLKGFSPGTARVSVKFAQSDINQSPFEVEVCDSTKCEVSGLFDQRVQLGEPIEFAIDCTGAGNDVPLVEVQGPRTKYLPEGQKSNDGDTYTFSFAPTEIGLMKVTIFFGGGQILGSPFEKLVEDIIDPDSCSARGPGLARAVATRPAKFVINTPEKGLLNKSRESLSVEVVSEDRKTKIESTIEDLQDTTYGVTYTVPVEGEYLITIKVYGKPIPGCDFRVTAYPKPDAAKCRVYGPSMHPNALLLSGRPLELYIDTSNAGHGELQAVVQGPKHTTPKLFMAEENKIYSLRIDSEFPGWYRINVWWGQVHVPKSPIDLKVHQAPDASKVRAYGPGLGPQIEVHKPAEFFILTRDAGIGTLTVVVHGVKDAFDVDVKAENPIDPRTLKGLYYPREGGDYHVTIKWSGVEIPGSPFQVKVTDTSGQLELQRQERQKEKKRRRQQEMLRQQRLIVMQGGQPVAYGVNPTYAPVFAGGQMMTGNPTMMGMMAGAGGGANTTKTVTTETTLQRQHRESKSKKVVESSGGSAKKKKKSLEVSEKTEVKKKAAAKRELSIEGESKKSGWLKASLTEKSEKKAKVKEPRSRKLSEPLPITQPASSSSSKKPLRKHHTSSNIADVMARNASSLGGGPISPTDLTYRDPPKLKRSVSFSEEEESSVRPKGMNKSYSFDKGHIPVETPIKYNPVYVATGELDIEEDDFDLKQEKKKKKKKKK